MENHKYSGNGEQCDICGHGADYWWHLMVQEPPVSTDTGVKYDQDKTRWDLMPWDALEPVAQVLTVGAKKYAPDNWKHVPGARWRYFGAAIRHIIAWWGGEKEDPETGLPHLAHAMCCLLFLVWHDGKGDMDGN